MVLRALHRLIWANQVAVRTSNAFLRAMDKKQVSPKAFVDNATGFNELLALGYMEKDKINVRLPQCSLVPC